MKYGAILSFILGLLGLIWIFYCHSRTELRYAQLGQLSNLVTLYTYTTAEIIAITVSQIIGLAFGLIAAFKQKSILLLFSTSICAINLFILWLGNPF